MVLLLPLQSLWRGQKRLVGLIPIRVLMDVEGTSALSTALGTIVLSTTGATVLSLLLPYCCCRFDLNRDFECIDPAGPLALAVTPGLTDGVSW